MDFLRRIGTEPQGAPAQLQQAPTFPQQTPIASALAARTRDPNAPENKYQVNQKCIYERQLPGGSYITAHLQRLQSGYYDSPVIHEDLIDNVRFVGINFVFHPSRTSFRFKSACIRVALHNIWTDDSNPLKNAANVISGQVPDDRRHSHATQTSDEHLNGQIVKYGNRVTPHKATRPKFLRHAPHLLYGAVSPETLDWNFNVAGSVGISQGPASASIKPSGGVKSSYKLYEMMKIQGSVRTLRSWYGHEYDIEDGEIVWTLEENRLQKSGLPREFTFVMLLTKGSSNIDEANLGDLTLDIAIVPKVAGFFGQGSFPNFVNNFHSCKPYHYPPLNLDLEIGQIFEPSEKGRGFNFARLSSQFDDYVFLPGTTHSKSDGFMTSTSGQGQDQSTAQGQQALQTSSSKEQQTSKQARVQQALPPTDGNTLNLRVFLENSRGSPPPLNAPVSYLHLRPPSRKPSPLPTASVSGSQRSHKRTITITSQKPAQPQSRVTSSSSAASRPQSTYDRQDRSRYGQPQQRQRSLRKTRSRSELNSEYNSSPTQEKSQLVNYFRSSPVPEQHETVHDMVTNEHGWSRHPPTDQDMAPYSASVYQEEHHWLPQPDSQTLPQHEFLEPQRQHETSDAAQAEVDQEGRAIKPVLPRSATEGTNDWQTPPETRAELQASPILREQRSRVRSRPVSNVYADQPSNLRTTDWSDDSALGSEDHEPRSYRSHASQVDTGVDDQAHPDDTHAADTATPHPLSYAPVQAALSLAMAEHGGGLAPGSTASHGFGNSSVARKAVPSSHAAALPSSSPAETHIDQPETGSISALPEVPGTPPVNVHKRGIGTSNSMGEATGVWNESPQKQHSPIMVHQRNAARQAAIPQDAAVSRSYSQRTETGIRKESDTSSPVESMSRKTRTIRYSYPAVGQADRYYRYRTEGKLWEDDDREHAEGRKDGDWK